MRLSALSFHVDGTAPKVGAALPALGTLLATVPPQAKARSVLITHVLDTASIMFRRSTASSQ